MAASARQRVFAATVALLGAVLITGTGGACADEPTTSWLVGSWLGTIGSDQRPRRLDVPAETSNPKAIAARFGYADVERAPVTLSVEGREGGAIVTFEVGRQRVTLRATSPNELVGTIDRDKGASIPLSLRRATEAELREAATLLRGAAAAGSTPLDGATRLDGARTFLTGPWTVTVDDGPRRRRLEITEVARDAEGRIQARGLYGWEGTKGTRVSLWADIERDHLVLRFWTNANSQIVVRDAGGDRLEGQFVNPKGVESAVVLTRGAAPAAGADAGPARSAARTRSARIELIFFESGG